MHRPTASQNTLPMACRPGDLLLFAGRGWVSLWIRLCTFSRYSHVGVCAELWGEMVVFESTAPAEQVCAASGKMAPGVQAHWLDQRIETYDGKIWHLPLASGWELKPEESTTLTEYLLQFVGTPYDVRGALLSRIRQYLNLTNANLQELFCSELAAAALMRIKRLSLENSGRFTPGSLVRRLLRTGLYQTPLPMK